MRKKKNSGKQMRSPSDAVLHRTFHESKAVPVPSATHGLAHKLRSLSVAVTDVTKDDSLQLLGLEQHGHGVWRIRANLKTSTRCHASRQRRGNSATTNEEPSPKSVDTLNSKNNSKVVKEVEVVSKTENTNPRKRARSDSKDGENSQGENKRTTRRNLKDVVIQRVVSLVSNNNESDSSVSGHSVMKDSRLNTKHAKKKVLLSADVSESTINEKIVMIRTGNNRQITAKIKLDSGIRLRRREAKPISVLPSNASVKEKWAPLEVKPQKNVQTKVPVIPEQKDIRKSLRASRLSAIEDNVSSTEAPVEKISPKVNRKVSLEVVIPALNKDESIIKRGRGRPKSLRQSESKKVASEVIINDVTPPKMSTRKKAAKSKKPENKLSDQEMKKVSKTKTDDVEHNNSDVWNVSGGSDGSGKLKISRRKAKKGTLYWCAYCGLELHSLQNKLEHEFAHVEPRELCVTVHRCILESPFIKVPTYVSSEEVAALKSPQEDSCSSVGSIEGRPRLLVENVINHEEYNAYDYDYSSDGEGSFSGDRNPTTVDTNNVECSQNCELTCNSTEGGCIVVTPEKVDSRSPNSCVEGSRSKKKSHTKMRLWDGPPTTRSGRVVKVTQRSWENSMEKLACSKKLFSKEENEDNIDEELVKEAEDVSEKLCQPIDEYVEVVPMKGDSKDTIDSRSSETSDVIESCAIDGETSQELNLLVKDEKEHCAANSVNELDPEHAEKVFNGISTDAVAVEPLDSDDKPEDSLEASSSGKNDADSSSAQEKLTEVERDSLAVGEDAGGKSLSNLSDDVHPFDEVLGNSLATKDGTFAQSSKQKLINDETVGVIVAVGDDQKPTDEVLSNEITSELPFDGVVEENNACGTHDSDLAVEDEEVEEMPRAGIDDGLVVSANNDDGCKDVMLVDPANADLRGSAADETIKGQISAENDFQGDDGDEDRFSVHEEGLEDISDGEWEDIDGSEMRDQDGLDEEAPDVEMIEALEDVELSRNANLEGRMDMETEKGSYEADPACDGENEVDSVEEEEMEEEENEMETENGSDKKIDSLDIEDIEEPEEIPIEVNMAEEDEDPEDGGMMGLIDSVADGGMPEVDAILEEEGEAIINDQEYDLNEQDEENQNSMDKGTVDEREEGSGQDIASVEREPKPTMNGRDLVALIENVENISGEYFVEKEKITEAGDSAFMVGCKDTVEGVTENLDAQYKT